MMTISALPAPGATAAGPVPVSSAVTVTIALTSRPPAGRYGFWSMSTVNPGRLVIALSWAGGWSADAGIGRSCPCPRPDAVGHVHQFYLAGLVWDEAGKRTVAALKAE